MESSPGSGFSCTSVTLQMWHLRHTQETPGFSGQKTARSVPCSCPWVVHILPNVKYIQANNLVVRMNSRNHLSVVSIHGVSAVCICIRLEVLSLLSATSFPYLFLIVMEMLTPHPGCLSWSFACGQMTSTPKLCLSGTFGDNWSLKSRCAWENLTNLSIASELPGHTLHFNVLIWCVVCVVCVVMCSMWLYCGLWEVAP